MYDFVVVDSDFEFEFVDWNGVEWSCWIRVFNSAVCLFGVMYLSWEGGSPGRKILSRSHFAWDWLVILEDGGNVAGR